MEDLDSSRRYQRFILVKKEDKWGIINTHNEVVCPFIYDEILNLDYGQVNSSNEDQNVDSLNEERENSLYWIAHRFHRLNLLQTKIGNHYGIMNCDGTKFTECNFDKISIDGNRMVGYKGDIEFEMSKLILEKLQADHSGAFQQSNC